MMESERISMKGNEIRKIAIFAMKTLTKGDLEDNTVSKNKLNPNGTVK
jgi:hypothetical protein